MFRNDDHETQMFYIYFTKCPQFVAIMHLFSAFIILTIVYCIACSLTNTDVLKIKSTCFQKFMLSGFFTAYKVSISVLINSLRSLNIC